MSNPAIAAAPSASKFLSAFSALSPDSATPLLCVKDDGQILFQNAANAHLLKVANKVPPDWLPALHQALLTRNVIEFQYVGAHQTYKYILLPFVAEKLVLCLGIDITQHVKATHELYAEHEFARQVMENMGQGLTVTDAERRFEYVNPAYARMLGYRPEELIGKTPADVTFPADHQRAVQAYTEKSEPDTTRRYEIRLKRADGSAVPVLFSGVSRMRNGQIVGTIAVVTDLSEQKLVEAEIAQKNRQLAQARDDALEAIARVASRHQAAGAEKDRFEIEDTAFHQRLREAFFVIAAREPGRCALIDAQPAPEAVAAAIAEVTAARLGL